MPSRAALLVVLFSLMASVRAWAEERPRPNFVVLLCDDLGYGDLGCYGHPAIRTPQLDQLAAQGMRLTDCYASAPVCSPSRSGLLTGRTPTRIGIYDWIPANHVVHLRRSEVTIATLLRQAGYATCQVGKWHCNGKFNSAAQPQPGDHGFDYWMSTQNNAGPSHHDPNNFVRNGKPVGRLSGYSCQLVADEAIHWLKDGRDQAKPFFLFVCFHEPHEPIDSPPELVATYPEARKRGEALYYANVTNVDRAVGRLLATLETLKAAEQTLVFFTSDNGPETLNRYENAWRSHGSPGPLRGMKLHIYDGGIRVPGILRWPGHIPPGQVVREPVCNLDLLPTFCALAGVTPPQDRALDGTNVAPLFDGNPIERKQPLFWHYYRALGKPKVALRDGDWKLVAFWDAPERLPGGNVDQLSQQFLKAAKLVRFELYNLRSDIGEQTDLAPQEPQRVQAMAQRLRQLYGEVIAEAPVWEFPKAASQPRK